MKGGGIFGFGFGFGFESEDEVSEFIEKSKAFTGVKLYESLPIEIKVNVSISHK